MHKMSSYTRCQSSWFTQMQIPVNKLPELKIYIWQHFSDEITISGALPKNKLMPVQECKFQLQGYQQLFTNLGQKSCSRGIVVYVRDGIQATAFEDLRSHNYIESVWISIRLEHKDKALIGCVYRGPDTTEDNTEELRRLLYRAHNTGWDLNMTTDWVTLQSPNQHEDSIIQTVQNLCLTQHVDWPTKYRGSDEPYLLDIILMNELDMVDRVDYHPPLGASDHLTTKLQLYAD